MEHFEITGMSCAACSSRVEKAVGSLEGVQECTVNLLTNSMIVEGRATREEITAAVKNKGLPDAVRDFFPASHRLFLIYVWNSSASFLSSRAVY